MWHFFTKDGAEKFQYGSFGGYAVKNITVISASQTYTVPAGISALYVECIGDGGGGGGSSVTGAGTCSCGSGGGGGAFASKLITSPAASYVVTVGAGGGSAANGAGTSFGVACVAGGGGGGATSGAAAGPQVVAGPGIGASSASCTGDVKIGGGYGDPGIIYALNQNPGGRGGSAGRGGGMCSYQFAAGATNGSPGMFPGGGGGGAMSQASSAGASGGQGAAGVCYVWELV